MTATVILLVVLYLGALVSYFFSETSGNFERRAVNKILMAGMFLTLGLGGLLEASYIPSVLGFLLGFGLLFSAGGDVALLWNFTIGGIIFGVGNLTIFAAYLVYLTKHGIAFSQYWWFLIIFAIFAGVWFYLWKSGWIDFGKIGVKMYLYLFTVMMHGTLSIAGLCFLHDANSILLFVGSILFMISDWFISLHKFKYKDSKVILRFNSGTYFVGLLLMALGCRF